MNYGKINVLPKISLHIPRGPVVLQSVLVLCSCQIHSALGSTRFLNLLCCSTQCLPRVNTQIFSLTFTDATRTNYLLTKQANKGKGVYHTETQTTSNLILGISILKSVLVTLSLEAFHQQIVFVFYCFLSSLFLPHFRVCVCACSVMSNSLQPHELQYTRPPCPSPSPKICPNSCLLHW